MQIIVKDSKSSTSIKLNTDTGPVTYIHIHELDC